MLHNPDLSTHVYAVSRPGDCLIHFGSKPMLLHSFQRFSHVVLRFSCMSPCEWHTADVTSFECINDKLGIGDFGDWFDCISTTSRG